MMLRIYGINGYLERMSGIILGKPYEEAYYEEYNQAIRKVLAEFGKEELPVLVNMNFGHTEPKFCLPYGALAEINCEDRSFSILESAVL
jgi:muramoyltetrapeptide carboxypeptidase LdcA involved in peptidoglycan recycling